MGLLGVQLGLSRGRSDAILVARVRLAAVPSFVPTGLQPVPAWSGAQRRYGDLAPRPDAQGPAVPPSSWADGGGSAATSSGSWADTGIGAEWGLSGEPAAPPRPEAFQAVPEPLPSLNAQALLRLAAEVAGREKWAWLPLPDTDTTNAEGRARAKARQIVLRAIDAMGGMNALLAVRQVKVRVWVVATEHVRRPCMGSRADCVVPLRPYPFLVEEWEMGRDGQGFVARSVRARLSFDLDHPNDDEGTAISAIRNPEATLSRYLGAFGFAGYLFPAGLRVQQQAAEAERWHFVSRFLGEGVELAYLDAEEYDEVSVEAIRVLDRKYGHESEAFFERRTGLLLAMRDRAWNGVVWETTYGDYRDIGGVRVPHRLKRHCQGCPVIPVVVHLQLAFNGAEPPARAPVLEGE
ncbi:MAG: hypothetical protein WDA75_17045 [Candidatus Latescibacterota bacterium]